MKAFSFLLLLVTLLGAQTLITPDHNDIQYTGRIDFSDKQAPVLYWPGTYFTAHFSGTSFKIILDDEQGENFYNIILDGKDEKPVIVECQKGEHTYTIAAGMPDGEHCVTIFRRTEGFSGPTIFKGFILDHDAELFDAQELPRRKIEFFGDSITCGMGNEAHPDSADDVNSERNNYLAYGAITARLLDAEYVCTAKSGIGIMVSWFPMIMPEYYKRLNPADANSRWDFSNYIPDVVVINLFQNDSWLVEKRLDPIPTKEQRIQAFVDFIRLIRAEYADAAIFCVLGSMDATKAGSPWPGYITQAAEKIKTEDNFDRIYTHFFEFKEFYKHPRVMHHQQNAQELAWFIRDKMGWTD